MDYKKIIGYTLCLLMAFCLSWKDETEGIPTGMLYLNVEEDASLQTRATSEVTYESLRVAIIKGEEDTLKVYNDYLEEVKGERLILPIGTYTVAVTSNHDGTVNCNLT